MDNISFEKAKEIASNKAKEYGKVVVSILENDEYWFFEAGLEDGSVTYDNGAGSIYISKIDGSQKEDNYYLSEFNQKFLSNAKEIYNIFSEKITQ